LTRVPNLKQLDLQLGSPLKHDHFDGPNEEYWRQHPVQKLYNLQVFSYTINYDKSGELVPLIHQQVECFCANGNLKRLYFTSHHPETPLKIFDDEELSTISLYQDLPILQENCPKLEKLVLDVFDFPPDGVKNGQDGKEYCNIATLFNVLQVFAETLKELDYWKVKMLYLDILKL